MTQRSARPLTQLAALAAAIALAFATLAALWIFARALALFVLAVTLASSLSPLVGRVERHVPRIAAVIAVYGAILGGLVALGYIVTPSLTGDLPQLGTQLGDIASRVSATAARILPIGTATLSTAASEVMPRLVAASSRVATASVDVLVVVFLSLYFLLAAPDFHRSVRWIVPRREQRRVSRLLVRMSQEMGGYFRGAAINGVVVAVLTWIALRLLGINYAVPLAVLAFVGELVPYLGPILAGIPAVAIALTDSTALAATVALTYVAIQQVEGHVLTPMIMHSQTHMSPALVIVALTMGYTAGGILGALSAIPVFAAARVVIRQVVAPAVRRRTRAREPRAHPAA